MGDETIVRVPRGHCGRCDRCGWPYAVERSEGCAPGDCSMRPLPDMKTHCPGCLAVYDDVIGRLASNVSVQIPCPVCGMTNNFHDQRFHVLKDETDALVARATIAETKAEDAEGWKARALAAEQNLAEAEHEHDQLQAITYVLHNLECDVVVGDSAYSTTLVLARHAVDAVGQLAEARDNIKAMEARYGEISRELRLTEEDRDRWKRKRVDVGIAFDHFKANHNGGGCGRRAGDAATTEIGERINDLTHDTRESLREIRSCLTKIEWRQVDDGKLIEHLAATGALQSFVLEVELNVKDVRGALTKTACRIDGRIDETAARLSVIEMHIGVGRHGGDAAESEADRCEERDCKKKRGHQFAASPFEWPHSWQSLWEMCYRQNGERIDALDARLKKLEAPPRPPGLGPDDFGIKTNVPVLR